MVYRVIMFMLVFIVCSYGGDREAMFGLEWGSSPSEIIASGVVLESKGHSGNLYTYTCTSLPKDLSITESYRLLFDGDTSLVKIIMASDNFEDDPYGSRGQKKFSDIVGLLSQKYTVAHTYCYSGKKLYDGSDEFYQCLKYTGCGMWAVLLSGANKDIVVELCGINRGTGYLKIVVESKPGFDRAIAKFKANQDAEDSDAF